MTMAESSPDREKTLGKGEIAHYEQFLLFQQCFQKTCTTDTYKPGLIWERVKLLIVTYRIEHIVRYKYGTRMMGKIFQKV